MRYTMRYTMKANRRALLTAAVDAAFAVAASKGKATDAARALFAGIPAQKRDEVRGEWYDAIRARAGERDGKKIPARELPEDVKRAYGAAREAYRAIFGSGAKKSKGKGKGKVIVVPMTYKGISAMAKAAKRALQKAEGADYDVPRVLAAWVALEEAYKPLDAK